MFNRCINIAAEFLLLCISWTFSGNHFLFILVGYGCIEKCAFYWPALQNI